MAAYPVELSPFRFPSKSAAEDALKRLLRQNRGNDLAGEDLLLAEAVLRAHPHADQKLKNGYKGMRVAQDPKYGTWCLWVINENNELEDVSYRVAIGLAPSEPTLQTAGRHLLKQTMDDFRRRGFATGPVRCVVSGQPLRENEAHVDHTPPWTFDSIVRAYRQHYGSPALKHEGTQDVFCQSSDADQFLSFHNERAELRIVHSRVNLSDLRKRSA